MDIHLPGVLFYTAPCLWHFAKLSCSSITIQDQISRAPTLITQTQLGLRIIPNRANVALCLISGFTQNKDPPIKRLYRKRKSGSYPSFLEQLQSKLVRQLMHILSHKSSMKAIEIFKLFFTTSLHTVYFTMICHLYAISEACDVSTRT